ncbi:hypothetical protein J5N97_007816 [Dioscorea zingiberensis]|uniref:Coilin n=1 Tax=Dioscorea zingiberensis TaxID=325984 RepID=A0A9D5HU09_9LILI|nr:hypothetical protein J5N97_007816 [Dioscorea zingiberensis]
MEQPIRRVRVVFDDYRHVLTKPQRLEGLKSCWLLLRPELTTISDLASHVFHRFHLRQSCPLGVVLSIDGFVLPPFESTWILKDEDIIRVRKKDSKLKAVEIANGDCPIQKNLETMERLPLKSSGEVRVNMEIQEELEGYKHEDEEACDLQIGTSTEPPLILDLNSKRKRSDPDELQKSKKKKKSKVVSSDKPIVSDEDAENVPLLQKQHFSAIGGSSHGRSHIKEKPLRENCKSIALALSPVGCSAMGTTNSEPNGQRTDQVEESSKVKSYGPCADGPNKPPSRNARRKKDKRQLLRELTSQKNHTSSSVPVKAIQRTSPGHDMENEIIPLVVRPGHIRFETIGQSKQQQLVPLEDLQWNGTNNKKRKGWDKDINGKGVHVSEVEHTPKYNADKGESPIVHVDFERLFPLTRLPKEGDVVAYRMIELSSAWSAKLSSFRVGKVSSYDPISMKISLVSVPEYPLNLTKKKDVESSAHPNVSPYKEDGSLEIEYRSLVDVRLFNSNNQGSSNAFTFFGRKTDKWEVVMATKSMKGTCTPYSGDWDEFLQSSNEAPKLVEKDGWGEWPKENPEIALWFDYCRSLKESKSFFPKRDNWRRGPGKSKGTYTRYFHCPPKAGK